MPLPSSKITPPPVRTLGGTTSPFETNDRVLSDYRPSPALLSLPAGATTPPSCAWGVLPYPFKTTLSFSIGFFLESPHHSFSQRSRPYPDHRSACTLHAFTVPQLRIREPATPHDRELGSRGMIAFSLPPLFFSFLHHVAAVDNSLQQLRVRVQLRIFINSSSIIFLKDLVLLVGFSSCPVFVCATIRVVVLVFSSNVPAIGLAPVSYTHLTLPTNREV